MSGTRVSVAVGGFVAIGCVAGIGFISFWGCVG